MSETYEITVKCCQEISWDGDQEIVLEHARQLVERLDGALCNFQIVKRIKGEEASTRVESSVAVLSSVVHVGAS